MVIHPDCIRDRNYTHTLRCSKETKELITGKCRNLLFPNLSYIMPQGVILQEMAKFVILSYEESLTSEVMMLSPEISNKLKGGVLYEFLKYNPDRKNSPPLVEELIERVIEHYIKSGPR